MDWLGIAVSGFISVLLFLGSLASAVYFYRRSTYASVQADAFECHPLLQIDRSGGQDRLAVFFDGEPLENPHVARFRVFNDGFRPVAPLSPLRLELQQDARVLSVSLTNRAPTGLEASARTLLLVGHSSTVEIAVPVLNPGNHLAVELIVDKQILAPPARLLVQAEGIQPSLPVRARDTNVAPSGLVAGRYLVLASAVFLSLLGMLEVYGLGEYQRSLGGFDRWMWNAGWIAGSTILLYGSARVAISLGKVRHSPLPADP